VWGPVPFKFVFFKLKKNGFFNFPFFVCPYLYGPTTGKRGGGQKNNKRAGGGHSGGGTFYFGACFSFPNWGTPPMVREKSVVFPGGPLIGNSCGVGVR